MIPPRRAFGSDGLFRAGLVASAALLCLWTSEAADKKTSIGQRIQFSNTEDAAPELPKTRRDEREFSRPFEFLDRGNSVGGVVDSLALPGPSAVPSLPKSRKLIDLYEERMDQKKNWIFNQPEDLTRTATVNEMFGVRENNAAAGTDSNRPRRAWNSYYEGGNRKRTGDADAGDRTGQKKKDGLDSNAERKKSDNSSGGSRFGNPLDSTRAQAAGISFPADWFGTTGNSLSNPLNNPLTTIYPRTDTVVNPVREQESQVDDFRRLLVTPGINPLAAGFDPINLRADSARQGLGPAAVPGNAAVKNPLDAWSSGGGRVGPGAFGALGDQGTTLLGNSSLSPAVSAPAEPVHAKPRPVLEIPRRKF
jgi:hypothetical protein